MKNLLGEFGDSNGRNVLAALESSIEEFEKAALLEGLRTGSYGLEEFGFITKVRLDAATRFVDFLSATEEKARRGSGWTDVADAMRENLNEELGMIDGMYDPEKDHDQWRQHFRTGVQRVLKEQAVAFDTIDVAEPVSGVSILYGDALRVMASEQDIAYLAGAFTVLEGVLEQEFSAMLLFIRKKLQGLTAQEEFYITHHAGHEHRHFEEAKKPLLEKCAASPHSVPSAIAGIEAMTQLRLSGVLGMIEKGLRRFTQ